MSTDEQNLDFHCQMILEEYDELRPSFEMMKSVIENSLKAALQSSNIMLFGMESRIKTRNSLIGKLLLKGEKYATASDLTDLVGVRVITTYTDEVDKISVIAENIFDIDWQNSIDKRKSFELNSFGYMSLHYICRIPERLYKDPEHPEINEMRFELQMRTALQHVWASIDHDTGYKTKVDIPPKYLRNISRLAGILELVDEQFSIMRREINDYRRQVEQLVSSGNFDELALNGDTFRSYMAIKPFKGLTERIAAVNQAEIFEDNFNKYLEIFKFMGFESIGDIERMRTTYEDAAYQLAVHQIADTDIDILAASVGLQNLCTVYILKTGGGEKELSHFYNFFGSNKDSNLSRAQQMVEQAQRINLI